MKYKENPADNVLILLTFAIISTIKPIYYLAGIFRKKLISKYKRLFTRIYILCNTIYRSNFILLLFKLVIMKIHFHVKIEWELKRIREDWETVLDSCSPTKAWNILQKATEEWKKYRAWCDNMKADWSCWGHEKTLTK